MKKLRYAALLAVALAGGLGARPALAQYPLGPRPLNPYGPPGYSPYLNLLRRGNPTFVNYYGLVRPELDLRYTAGSLQQQVNNVGAQANANTQAIAGLPETGHTTAFMNYSHFFGGGAGGGAGIVAGRGGAIRGASSFTSGVPGGAAPGASGAGRYTGATGTGRR
jgi:hypothetical protein